MPLTTQQEIKNILDNLKSLRNDISNSDDKTKVLSCDGWIKRYNELLEKIKKICMTNRCNKKMLELLMDLNENFNVIPLTGSQFNKPNLWTKGIQGANEVKNKIDDLMGYLEPTQPMQKCGLKTENTPETPLKNIILICSRFSKISEQLKIRYNKRKTLEVNDEYDVQDLLHSLLLIFFDDVRREEPTPSHAGKSSRMDILLKKENIVIEVKITSDSKGEKQLGEEITLDYAYYKSHANCKLLVCFIFDPKKKIRNPTGFINDLEKMSEDNYKIKIIVEH